jgi:preprotein translocase subunit SecA
MRRAERIVLLNVLDAAWMDHLHEMDYLQEGIGLRAMGQRDPLVEYQREGFDLFQVLLGRIREDFARYIFHVQATVAEPQQAQQRRQPLTYTAPAKTSEAQARQAPRPAPQPAAGPQQPAGSGGAPAEEGPVYETVRREGDKVGRNDPCPCGSGKKYKKCHGAAA